MASWKRGARGANAVQREGTENRVCIARMSQNLTVVTVCGVVIAKQSPRTVAPNAQTGEDRCVLNFTLRDTEVDTINVACWGDCTQVKQMAALFRIGDCVQIANVLVKSRNTGTASDSFAPKVSSPYQLVANLGRDNKCELNIAEEALFCQMMPLLHVPLASVSDVTPIADVMYCGRQMADEHINMLVGVKRFFRFLAAARIDSTSPCRSAILAEEPTDRSEHGDDRGRLRVSASKGVRCRKTEDARDDRVR